MCPPETLEMVTDHLEPADIALFAQTSKGARNFVQNTPSLAALNETANFARVLFNQLYPAQNAEQPDLSNLSFDDPHADAVPASAAGGIGSAAARISAIAETVPWQSVPARATIVNDVFTLRAHEDIEEQALAILKLEPHFNTLVPPDRSDLLNQAISIIEDSHPRSVAARDTAILIVSRARIGGQLEEAHEDRLNALMKTEETTLPVLLAASHEATSILHQMRHGKGTIADGSALTDQAITLFQRSDQEGTSRAIRATVADAIAIPIINQTMQPDQTLRLGGITGACPERAQMLDSAVEEAKAQRLFNRIERIGRPGRAEEKIPLIDEAIEIFHQSNDPGRVDDAAAAIAHARSQGELRPSHDTHPDPDPQRTARRTAILNGKIRVLEEGGLRARFREIIGQGPLGVDSMQELATLANDARRALKIATRARDGRGR